MPVVLLPKVPASPSRGLCSELVNFLHFLKIGLITSEGKQCIKLVGLQ